MTFSRKQIQDEIVEKSEDLRVFHEARELIRRRVLEVKDSESKLTPLPDWSGTAAVLGSLDLSIHAIQRTVEELQKLLENMPEEPKRAFRVIQGGSDEQEH